MDSNFDREPIRRCSTQEFEKVGLSLDRCDKVMSLFDSIPLLHYSQKYHYASYCYTINDGCWRDTLVRFGYDPRASNESRLYQKLTFQMKDKSRRGASTKRFSMLPATNERMDTSSRQEDEAGEEEGDDL